MLYIGIDPGFSSTGIVCLDDDAKVVFSYNLTMTLRKRKSGNCYEVQGKFVGDVTNCFISELVFKDSLVIGKDELTDYPQLILYYNSLRRCLEQFLVRDFYVAVEIPRMSHQGAGAKIERAFTSATILMSKFSAINILRSRIVTPGEVKKFVTGKGNAKKELIIKEVYKRYGFDTDINDIADAYAIARYLRFLEKGVS